jgi:cytoskeletal protein CcmA (bactofilin family)
MAETENTPSNDALSEPNSLETADDTNVSLESIGSGQPNVNPEHNSTELASEASSPPPTKEPDKKSKRFRRLRQRFNIPILLFGLVILIAFGIVIVAYLQSKKSSTSHAQTQSLSQSTLEQLANSDATVGNNQSILNVESSAVFAGQVLVRQNLQVAGNLQIGGTLALSNIAVAGTSQLGQATVNKNLAVAGDTAIQGSATIAKSLQVSSSGTFGGSLSAPQIVTSSLQLNGDLVLTHHISVGGSTPSRTTGSALGSGGSASVSGSDTAGAISINTGGGPAAGCFVTINFTASYTNTPFVQITPIGSSAGGLSYYVNRSATSFSVCDTSPPPAGASFGFDYFVVE